VVRRARRDAVHPVLYDPSRGAQLSVFLDPMKPPAELVDPVRSQWSPLALRQAHRLERLASRDPRTLSAADLIELERLANSALYCGDDGDYIYDDETDYQLERDDLSDEQRDWLRAVLRAVWDEHQRRDRLQQARRHRPADPLRRVQGRNDRPERCTVQVRPREHRPRSGRGRARSPGRAGDSDSDLAPRRRKAVAA
jgi:hypothetical protein